MPVSVDASGKACKGWAGNILNWSRFPWNEYGPRAAMESRTANWIATSPSMNWPSSIRSGMRSLIQFQLSRKKPTASFAVG
jgi:hypothetical protein